MPAPIFAGGRQVFWARMDAGISNHGRMKIVRVIFDVLPPFHSVFEPKPMGLVPSGYITAYTLAWAKWTCFFFIKKQIRMLDLAKYV